MALFVLSIWSAALSRQLFFISLICSWRICISMDGTLPVSFIILRLILRNWANAFFFPEISTLSTSEINPSSSVVVPVSRCSRTEFNSLRRRTSPSLNVRTAWRLILYRSCHHKPIIIDTITIIKINKLVLE